MEPTRTDTDFAPLRDQLSGSLTTQGDDGWDLARQAWNLYAQQQPAAVAQVEGVEDVQAVVNFARENGLRVAPQGTGHGATSLDDLSGSILLRTIRMTGVDLDPEARRARVNAGALSEDIANAASEHGLAALCGSSPDVGLAGYSLGGGMGWLGAQARPAVQPRCTAVELVTADGEVVRADSERNQDLFWALRGGGGNFGVVTALEFGLVEEPQLYAGMLAWPWERSEEVLERWAEWAAGGARGGHDLRPHHAAAAAPRHPRAAARAPAGGDRRRRLRAARRRPRSMLAPLRELGPEMDMWGPMPPAGLVRIHGDPEQPGSRGDRPPHARRAAGGGGRGLRRSGRAGLRLRRC